MMMDIEKTRTPEQVSKKMINEERTIMDLELAIKKEQFRNTLIDKTEFGEEYTKVTETTPHELDMSAVCWCSNQ
jgi:hypothetical protein